MSGTDAFNGRAVEPLLDGAGVGWGTRLLDLATGPGYVAARAAERGATAVGIDVAESMVALARRRHPGRTSALIASQPQAVQHRIRGEFDVLVEPHRATDGSLEIPVSVKLASGVKCRC